ncbi:hypothetical protein QN277_025731 [Acacia crassicarpa]|uniref:MULE transposase domain-containing protein n=1 Tax=Acacia crassicarpa TaxID=499986 RepID=A0AAE1J968_9FABA|nr:hypothetical protein QN277_025731 [Acacia crassicarpa]
MGSKSCGGPSGGPDGGGSSGNLWMVEAFCRQVDNATKVVSETKTNLRGDGVGSGKEVDVAYWREKRNYLDLLTKDLCDFSKKLKDVADDDSVNRDGGGEPVDVEACFEGLQRRHVEGGELEGDDVRHGAIAVEVGVVDATEDLLEALHDNGENDNLSASEGDEEQGEDWDESERSECGSHRDVEDESDDEDFLDDENVVDDDGEDGSGFEDEDSEDESGQSGGDGPLLEVRGSTEICGSNGRPFFTLESSFADKKHLLATLDQYAIKAGVNIHLTKSGPLRGRARCEKGCPFVVFASKHRSNPNLVVKTLNLEHSCSRVFKNPRASVKWLATHFKQKVQERPQYKVSDMKKDCRDELKLHVSIHKCKRAKKMIMEEMEGSYVDEFNKLEAYLHELRTSNPGSDISVEISKEALESGRRVFSRMYLCLNASKTGWKAGCRPIIGVDGTFLKGKARGMLLTATGLDADDSLYPIAFAVTQKENTHNWKWFIEWIRRSLGLEDGNDVTIMSDMQKGLMNAVSTVLPLAEH